jgi:hypothetical protein
MGLSENNEHALSRRSPKFKWEFAAVIGLKLPRNLRGEYVASAKVAERVGFEPTVRFPAHTLSKRAP